MPSITGVRVVRSSIHGYGLIATRAFKEGEIVATIDGVLYAEEDLTDDTYCLWMDDGYYVDMVDQTRWINHSCDPNCAIEGELAGSPAVPTGEPGAWWAHVIAERDIAVGEELTYDYAFPAALAERCGCGTVNCRGWIVDADELQQIPNAAVAVAR